MSCGCGSKNKSHSETKREVVREVIDPVCGMSVEPEESQKLTFQGRDYHFCSSGCVKRFERNPGNFVSAA